MYHAHLRLTDLTIQEEKKEAALCDIHGPLYDRRIL